MYQMPYGGGYPPYQQGEFPPQGGFPPYQQGSYPPPPNSFNGGYGNDDDSEYEYITDDDGDYIEDEDGTILTIGEAQTRGLIAPAQPGEGERGIGKKLLIGGAVLGGVWMLRKQVKKKKKVKKQKNKNNQKPTSYNNNTSYMQQNLYGQPQQSYGRPPPTMYGQNIYGGSQKRDVPGGFGGPGFGGPGFGGPGFGRPG
eukprot:jgi/Orpsp1_1/1185412/evm.model.c7180000093636.1